jgi:hypothetical protein
VERNKGSLKEIAIIVLFALAFSLMVIVVDNCKDYEAEVKEYIKYIGLTEVQVSAGKGYEHYIRIPNTIHRQTMVDYVINLNSVPPHQLQPGDYIAIPTPYEGEYTPEKKSFLNKLFKR